MIFMETISENPPRKKRGRPSIFSPFEHRGAVFVAGNRTPRQQNNAMYTMRALTAISHDPRFAWLGSELEPASQGKGRLRRTILAELGRVEDPEELEALALAICAQKPTVRQARAMIRQVRLPSRPPGTFDQLLTVLVGALNTYLAEHAPMAWDDIDGAVLALHAAVAETMHEAGD
jgi:hypothetical protein